MATSKERDKEHGKRQDFPSSHRPGNLTKNARFPHSHSSDD